MENAHSADDAAPYPAAAQSTQRVRSVRLPTRVHPDVLLPYLYGERGINRIMRATGCAIDYCAQSPEEASATRAVVMNFLLSGASTERLEDATRQLRTLVDRLQVHLQKKARVAEDSRFFEPERRPKRDAAEDRWTEEDTWRTFYGGQRRARFGDETDEKRPGRQAEVVTTDATYRPPFVARRRVRRYPDHPRWTSRGYPAHPRGDVGYAMAGPEQTRVSRPRPRVYPGPSHFAEFGYEFEDENAEFEYDAADVATDNAGVSDQGEFVEVAEQPVQHPRRSVKRPLSMRSDGPPPPIYRQRVPYIYDYSYEDEDDEWMTEDEDMVAYGYPPQFRHMEVPVVHRRRRLNSVSSQQWSPAGRMFKRRRIPREEVPHEHEMSEEAVFEPRERELLTPPGSHVRTAFLDQLDEVAERTAVDTLPGREDDDDVPMDESSTVASLSETRSDNIAHHAKHGESSPVVEITQASNSNEALTELNVNLAANTSTLEPTEQENSNPNDDLLGSVDDEPRPDAEIKQGASIQRIAQREVVPLTSLQGTADCTLPQRSTASASSPSSKSPRRPLDEEESRIASPPHSVASDESRDIVGGGDHVIDNSAARTDCLEAGVSVANNGKPTQPPVILTAVEAGVQRDTVANDAQPTASTTKVESPVESVVTDTIRINNRVIASLERMNKEEAAFELAKTSLTAQEDKFCQLDISSKHHHRLEVLCGIMYELQCQIGSQSCGLSQSSKQQLLDKLDSYLEMLLMESEQTLEEKVSAMQDGLKHLLTMDKLGIDKPVPKSGAMVAKPITIAAIAKPVTPSTPVGETPDTDKVDEVTNMEDDDWFEDTAPIDPASDSEEQDNFVAPISPKKSNLKFEGDLLAVKLEQGASLHWPRELPPFVWSLLARVISSDPQSFVMRVTHKRLMDEVAKGDPYYYLHPTVISNDTAVSSPLRSQLCEFGCRGASALKWERKLVSQISSRMKSFDNVAYSLARSSGGKEVLNRKKMNSIIRKLHLVAMQLHSLVSHLYCVKGQTTCKEVDSLPIALNNSHFERKMGVYKSRLKLVVPHKYQQQQSPQQQPANMSEPTEELLRDTYEFFPELLLCVDIWGYNYREGRAKRHNSKSVLGETYSGSRAAPEGVLFPLGFFRDVETLAFDFEHDSNGLLRCICDELLNIVCLWNDFKWTDNLDAIALERVVSFETDVTASILKILELYAHHLQALWAVRLLDEPEQLRSVHFTQFNAYYSDRSQGRLNPTAVTQTRPTKSPTSGPNANASTVDQMVANEIVEQRLAEEYWNRKVTALSIHNPDDDAMDVDGTDPKPSQLLSAEAICSWDHDTLVSYLLRWSDVYAIRGDVNALSAVTNHMLKHEVQQYRHANRGGNIETGGSGVNNTIVDTASRQLLAAVSRAQMLIRDALIGAEKLALHSASNQLPDERKYPGYELAAGEASGVIQSEDDLSREVSLDQVNTSTSSGGEESREQADEVAASEPELASRAVGQPNVLSDTYNNAAVQQDTTFETGIASDQPELRDLIQLLAVTKQDIQELCGHRPRSARMREKVQTQSVQLARQTVEIFRNIKNMYGTQQRR